MSHFIFISDLSFFRSQQSNFYGRLIKTLFLSELLWCLNYHFFLQAQERQETAFRAPRQRVEDFEELHEYRGRKRKEFEERIRRTRGSM